MGSSRLWNSTACGGSGTTDSFGLRVAEAVDRGLAQLGPDVTEAIYRHIELAYGIRRDQIAYRAGEFSLALSRIFGIGASYVERIIVQMIKDDLGAKTKTQRLRDVVEEAREKAAL